MIFRSLFDMISHAVDLVRPPERLLVWEAAEKYRQLYTPGSYVGPYKVEITPYMREPMAELTSLDFTGLVFMGPARCGKTEIFANWLLHTTVCDPADMMRIDSTQATARDFSQGELARFFRHNEIVAEKLMSGRYSDNVHDKNFTNGARLLIKWPTISELSGRTIPRLWIADYDRIPNSGDVDGEGPLFDLARKRAGTFGRHGMTVAESSPGYPVTDSKYIPKSRHEAPPTGIEGEPGGIAALYNRGDRRRWFWTCPDCETPYEPSFLQMRYPETDDIVEAGEMAQMECPHCGYRVSHEQKYHLNLGGRWVKDGQILASDGSLVGTATRSSIASFWLKGPAAGLVDWNTIVQNYLTAKRSLEETASEEALKSVYGLDLGEPFTPSNLQSDRLPEDLKGRRLERPSGVVPLDCRFLIASVDVQKNRFEVQVHGQHSNGDVSVIERFAIRKSSRTDADGDRYWVSPGVHPEDWRLLVNQVMLKTYPLAGDPAQSMMIKQTMCDSGGQVGVATQALNFYRWLRSGPPVDSKDDDGWQPGLHQRFQLVRGTGKLGVPRVKLDFPDAHRKDRHSGARGDVPVLTINSNVIKDWADKMLARTQPGGRVLYPSDLPDSFYQELCVEVRNAKGEWENVANRRNEAWDLFCYYLAGTLTPQVNLEHINFEEPPVWASDWDTNVMIVPTGSPIEPPKPPSDDETARLAELLA